MLSVDEARERILARVSTLSVEAVGIAQARGRVLAQEAIAPRDLPPWDNSALDGYAVRAADVATATRDHPVVLDVLETIPCGAMPARTVGRGQCCRIMTGAPMPSGADAVVMVEASEAIDGGARVALSMAVEAGNAVRDRGEDLREGQSILPADRRLGAAEVGLLASLGSARVAVFRRPVVAVLPTGDELVEPGEACPEGSIYTSNSYALCALVEDAGAVPLYLGIGRDDPADLARKMRRGLAEADTLLTVGGVSMGDFDYVKDVIDSLGGAIDFWKVAMRPGKPNAFGLVGGKPTFGLPGNPVSCLVSFHLFVAPALRRMCGVGEASWRPTVAEAVLDEPVRGKLGLRHFHRGVLRADGDRLRVRTTGPQGSGILQSMALANCLLVVPEDVEAFPAGTTVQVLPLHSPGWGPK